MKDEDKPKVELVRLDSLGRPIGNRGKRKKKPKGIPTKEEWADISRMMFNNIKMQLEDRNEDGLPTAPPALYATVNKIIHSTETVIKPPDTDSLENQQKKKLQELRDKRVRNNREYATQDEVEKLKRSQQETKAITLDEPPIIPWDKANTLDEE